MADSAAKQYLKVAKGLLSHPKRWIKGKSASDEYGRTLIPGSSEVTCWCATGAVEHAKSLLNGGGVGEVAKAMNALDKAAQKRGFSGIINMNDSPSTSHEEILAVFEEAANEVDALTYTFDYLKQNTVSPAYQWNLDSGSTVKPKW